MLYGTARFKEILLKYKDKRPMLLYGDPDLDGLFSLLLMCRFCDMLGIKYSYYCNGIRQHGFKLNPEQLKGYIVMAADFTITEAEVKTIVDNDIVLLSTDHHIIQDRFIDISNDTAEGIVVNNQYPFEDDDKEFLSGAGVFYEVAVDMYPEFKNDIFEAIVGITLLSDMRAIEGKEARRYLKKTYTADITNKYIKHLLDNAAGEDYSFGVPKLDRNFIDYSLSPKINSLLRFDKTKDAMNFILNEAPLDSGVRVKQKDLLSEMHKYADVNALSNITILSVRDTDFLDFDVDITAFIGLFCSDYKDKIRNKSTLGLVVSNGKIIRASFRGKYDNIHYRSGFLNMGIKADGHPGAFGINEFYPTESTWVDLNDLMLDMEDGYKYETPILEIGNLSTFAINRGLAVATENNYVRDMYRTYLQYTGTNIKERKRTYKMTELSRIEVLQGKVADVTKGSKGYIYERDSNGEKVSKYIEYEVDGRTVKSFGVELSEGLILPVLEKNYIQMYVRKNFKED